jgi:hypothetical protein
MNGFECCRSSPETSQRNMPALRLITINRLSQAVGIPKLRFLNSTHSFLRIFALVTKSCRKACQPSLVEDRFRSGPYLLVKVFRSHIGRINVRNVGYLRIQHHQSHTAYFVRYDLEIQLCSFFVLMNSRGQRQKCN